MGFQKTSMSAKLTKEHVIKEFIIKHGYTYDYSKFEYNGSNTKSIMLCKEHGEFMLTPSKHKQGRGCPKCGRNRTNNNVKITKDKFINRLKLISNIELLEFNSFNEIGKFKCTIHGEFENIPKRVLTSPTGCCNECGINRRKEKLRHSKEQMIHKLNFIHKFRYNYDKLSVSNYQEMGIITCKLHGDFSQLVANHAKGNGCPKCAAVDSSNRRRKDVEILRNEMYIKHNNKYEYPFLKDEYKSERSTITISCDSHGNYKQLLSNHLKGSGCFKCGSERRSDYNRKNPRGWSPKYWGECASKSDNFDSFKVYIIKCWNDGEIFFKIGKTYTTVEKRFKFKNALPYEYEILTELIFDCPYKCSRKEQELKNINKDNSYKPLIKFKGQYECFNHLPLQVVGLNREELVS